MWMVELVEVKDEMVLYDVLEMRLILRDTINPF